jgi:hypothetical protein
VRIRTLRAAPPSGSTQNTRGGIRIDLRVAAFSAESSLEAYLVGPQVPVSSSGATTPLNGGQRTGGVRDVSSARKDLPCSCLLRRGRSRHIGAAVDPDIEDTSQLPGTPVVRIEIGSEGENLVSPLHAEERAATSTATRSHRTCWQCTSGGIRAFRSGCRPLSDRQLAAPESSSSVSITV